MNPGENDILSAEVTRMDALMKIADRKEREAEWEKYREHFGELPESVRPLVSYEICRRIQSWGTSGFHGFAGSEYDPISFCGWADYGDGRFDQGVGFRINSACFGGRDAELYYTDDDMLERADSDGIDEWREKRLQTMLERIKASSSGIDDVRIHRETEHNDFRFRGRWQQACRVTSFRFRLNPSMIRETISLSRKQVPSSQLGGTVFVLPRAGEFFCELGEIVDGRRVPLHIDDFCMK